MIVPQFSSIAILAASIADQFGASFRKRWRLINHDWEMFTGDDLINMANEVEAQHDTDQVQFGYTTAVNSHGGFGDAAMGSTPGQNGPDSITINAVFAAEHAADDIRIKLNALRALRKYDVNMNRIPLVRFEYNDQVVLCWLTSLNITTNGTFPISGLPISANVSFTLIEAVERTLDSQRQGTERSTFYHVLRAGENFETLAARYLGNPRLSAHIRRTNPGVIEQEGASVKILPRMHSEMRKEIKLSAPFAVAGWEDVFEALAEERL